MYQDFPKRLYDAAQSLPVSDMRDLLLQASTEMERLKKAYEPEPLKRQTTGEKFLCKDRPQGPHPFKLPENDTWNVVGQDRVCSYCGSLHPEDLKAILADPDSRFSRTDKSYKIYANRKGVSNASDGGIKFYMWHLESEEQAHEMNRLIAARPKRADV